MANLTIVRQRFAEEVRQKAGIQTDALVAALASVPRERFLGAGPWRIGIFDGRDLEYRVSETADPTEVYCDALIAIDAARGLNNGMPSSLAGWIDALSLKQGETVVHIGCGTGYYTALIASVVGQTGVVIAYEIDPVLAARASEYLNDYSQVRVTSANTYELLARGVDAIFVNCGVTLPAADWLVCLGDRGRILFPVTSSKPGDAVGFGGMYLAKRSGTKFDLSHISGVGVFHCTGQRNERLNLELRAKEKADWRLPRTLRIDHHEKVDSCWLHGEMCCMSVQAV
jgi:protein-L-isoaspartate(D-aspartate) O-methyltransferase